MIVKDKKVRLEVYKTVLDKTRGAIALLEAALWEDENPPIEYFLRLQSLVLLEEQYEIRVNRLVQ